MNEVLERTAEAIRRNGFEVHVFDTAAQAADFLDAEIDGKFVGLGDSMTLGAMGLYERLLAHNPKVLDPQQGKDHPEFDAIADACWNAEVFLTSVNALAETGEMVNIDGHGNRVAQSIHGHQKVYFVAGRNKIEPTLERAVWRARNIAAPANAKRHGFTTPCVAAGHCCDCSHPDRICNALVVYLHPMMAMEGAVVLIDEDMGL